jgi:hypothetical protein
MVFFQKIEGVAQAIASVPVKHHSIYFFSSNILFEVLVDAAAHSEHGILI